MNQEDSRSGNDDNQNNDDRALMRHEFLDALIRIAITKYIGLTADPAAAVEMLFLKNVRRAAPF